MRAAPSSGSTLRSPSVGMDFEPGSRGWAHFGYLRHQFGMCLLLSVLFLSDSRIFILHFSFFFRFFLFSLVHLNVLILIFVTKVNFGLVKREMTVSIGFLLALAHGVLVLHLVFSCWFLFDFYHQHRLPFAHRRSRLLLLWAQMDICRVTPSCPCRVNR